MRRSKCNDICNFGYAFVSCVKAKVLEELGNSSVHLAKVNVGSAPKFEKTESDQTETKEERFSPTSTLPTPCGD